MHVGMKVKNQGHAGQYCKCCTSRPLKQLQHVNSCTECANAAETYPQAAVETLRQLGHPGGPGTQPRRAFTSWCVAASTTTAVHRCNLETL